jgi:hypothetical protein
MIQPIYIWFQLCFILWPLLRPVGPDIAEVASGVHPHGYRLPIDHHTQGDSIKHITADSRVHRVGRVLSYFSSRRNWDSPNPSPAGGVVPPWLWGSGTLAGERGVGRVPIPTRGQTLRYSLYTYSICTLW